MSGGTTAAVGAKRRFRKTRTWAVLLCACGLPAAAHAADGNWSNTAVDSNWSNPANWQGGVIPSGSGATANFLTDLNGFQSIKIASPGLTIGTLRFGDFDPSTSGDWSLEGAPITFDGPDCLLRTIPGLSVRASAPLIATSGLRMTGGGQLILFSSLDTGPSALRLDDGQLTLRAASPVGKSLNIDLATADHGDINLFFNSDGALSSAAASTSINIASSGHHLTAFVAAVKTGSPKINRIDSHISIAANQSATLIAMRDGASNSVPGYVRYGKVQLGAASTINAEAVRNTEANLILDLDLLGDATINNSSSNSFIHLGEITSAAPATLKLTGSNSTQLIGSLSANLDIQNTATTILTSRTAALGQSAVFAFNGDGRQISIRSGITQLMVDPAASLTDTARGRIDLSSAEGSLELRYNVDGTSLNTGQKLDIALAHSRPITAFANPSPIVADYRPRISIAAAGDPSRVDGILKAQVTTVGTSSPYVHYTDLRPALGALVQLESLNDVGLIADLALAGDASIQTPSAGRVYLNSIAGTGTLTLPDASGNRAMSLVGPLATDVLIATSAGATLTSLSTSAFSNSFSLGGRTLTLASTSGAVDVRVDPGAGTIRLAAGSQLLSISKGADGSPGLSASTLIDMEPGTRLLGYVNQSSTSLINTIDATVRVHSASSLSASRGTGSGVPGLVRFSNVTLDDAATATLDSGASNLLVDLHIPAGSASVQQTTTANAALIGRIDGNGTLLIPDVPGNRALSLVGAVDADVIQSNSAGLTLAGIQIGSYQSAFSLGQHTFTIRGGTPQQPVRLAASANPTSAGTFLVDGGVLRLERSADGTLIHKSGQIIIAADQLLASLRADATLDLDGFNLRTAALAGAGAIVNNSASSDSTLTIDSAIDSTFTGALRDSDGGHTLSLVKTGPASLTLSGPIGHAGPTRIDAGQLIFNGSIVKSDVTVGPAATLAGAGTIGGSLTVEPGGSLRPTGALTLRQLTLQANSSLAFNLGDPATSSRLLINELGGLAIGGPVSLRINDAGLIGGTTYTLLDYSGPALDNSTFSLFSLLAPSGNSYELRNDAAATAIKLFVSGGDSQLCQWIADADGDWSNAFNWSGGIPHARSAQAQFGSTIQTARTVNVDSAHTLGQITFESAHSYTLAGPGKLLFDNGPDPARLTVAIGAHAIRVPLEFAASANLNVVDGASLELAAMKFPAGAILTKLGNGRASITDPLDLNDGALDVVEGPMNLGSSLVAKSISIRAGASLRLDSPAAIVASRLAIDSANGAYLGLLDLGNGDLILHPDGDPQLALAEIEAMVRSALGSPAGEWKGNGITSWAALADKYTGLAVILNRDSDGQPLFATFANQPVDANSVIVSHTLNGDGDLTGVIDGSDYFRIDKAFLLRNTASPMRGYYWGDLDYNGSVDGSDYFLIDSAFLGQRSRSPAAQARAVPEPGTTVIVLTSIATALLARRRVIARYQAR